MDFNKLRLQRAPARAALGRLCGLYQARGGLALWLWLLSGNFVASPGWAAVCFKLLLLFGDLVASPSAGLLRTPDFLQRSQLSPAGVECSVYSCLDCR